MAQQVGHIPLTVGLKERANELVTKARYLLRSAKNVKNRKTCPYCGGADLERVDQKYVVTTLLRCRSCFLMARYPRDTEQFINAFYQSEYAVNKLITELPNDEKIAEMKASKFSNMRDYSPYIKAAAPDAKRVLDYGCSWGYHVYQLSQSGFDARGFELSKPRAQFGMKKLGVEIFSERADVNLSFDLILNSHVIEHLLDIPSFLSFCRSKLTDSGVFMSFCPNGSIEYRRREPDIFHVNWGFVHPNYLDISFAQKMLGEHPYLILTGDLIFDLEEISAWDGKSQVVGKKRDGKELLMIAKLNQRAV